MGHYECKRCGCYYSDCICPRPGPKVAPRKCNDHPRYGLVRRPRTACESCWRMWIAKNPRTYGFFQ